MTRSCDELPVSDHAVLRYLQRVCQVDIDTVRRQIHEMTAVARTEGARGTRVNGIVYRFKHGYVSTCFVGDPHVVKCQHAAAIKKILRKSRDVPILRED